MWLLVIEHNFQKRRMTEARFHGLKEIMVGDSCSIKQRPYTQDACQPKGVKCDS